MPPGWSVLRGGQSASWDAFPFRAPRIALRASAVPRRLRWEMARERSEEHTSELQSPCNLVCRLLLEKKKKTDNTPSHTELDHCMRPVSYMLNIDTSSS